MPCINPDIRSFLSIISTCLPLFSIESVLARRTPTRMTAHQNGWSGGNQRSSGSGPCPKVQREARTRPDPAFQPNPDSAANFESWRSILICFPSRHPTICWREKPTNKSKEPAPASRQKAIYWGRLWKDHFVLLLRTCRRPSTLMCRFHVFGDSRAVGRTFIPHGISNYGDINSLADEDNAGYQIALIEPAKWLSLIHLCIWLD